MFGTWPRNAERAFPPEPVLGSKPLVLDNHPRIVRAGLPDHRVFIGLILNSSGLGGTAGNASGGRHLEERFLERRPFRGRKDDGRSPATVREPGDFLCHALYHQRRRSSGPVNRGGPPERGRGGHPVRVPWRG